RGIIANPNCSTMQMLVALAPLHRQYGIERINVATYQSVSGGGRSALEELGKQTGQLLSFQDIDPQRFPVQIAFNLIPH
ncbi:Asd/ArgC dimerization domain-containing protein, partial [Klebsiella pneumoniae]|nr:Asd/ArgC dimerization domain-containing protein [Klebsiella pneumoniae]